ncbi:MAG: D-glycero-beta-D-manno-heptose 1-phosphate adenylyltransferase [Armatimonadetes bacterium]|jgi:rfaE bifunctional protein nucleotidyltransferase chain/domain|nr:D-glycero-beta-D-manno-heptose 1-phosphate adenylyltransferase [Armatimonadota bacterium]
MSSAEAAGRVAELQRAGKTIVFTNGCFDILHVGHVRYLSRARAMGDWLVAGVNTDQSVRALKGPERPVNSENDRAEVLAALECVDCVVLFAQDTPVELIEQIRPDIDVKGGDYKIDDMPEARVMAALGGRVEIIPFAATDSERFSTTETINRYKNR